MASNRKRKYSKTYGSVYVTLVRKTLRGSGTPVNRLYAQGQDVIKAVGSGERAALIAQVLVGLRNGDIVPSHHSEVIEYAKNLAK